MAYRRRQGITRVSTFKEEIHHPPDETTTHASSSASSSPSLAAQAIRASAAHRESSLSSAYGDSAFFRDSDHRLRSEVFFLSVLFHYIYIYIYSVTVSFSIIVYQTDQTYIILRCNFYEFYALLFLLFECNFYEF